MAPQPTYAKFFFRDNADTVREIVYRLSDEIDPAVAGTLATTAAAAAALETALDVLTWDHIDKYSVYWDAGGGGAAPAIQSNNQITAFTRTILGLSGDNGSFEVPAFDDTLYARDSNNMLSAAYNTAAIAVANLIMDPETGESMAVKWSQSRTKKLRGKRLQ